MKKIIKRIATAFLAVALLVGFCSCDNGGQNGTETQPTEFRDFASELVLDMSSDTAKQEVTVKTYIDGDTTHFNVPKTLDPDGVLKARYIAINTPESTGDIEPWGKKASNYTKERLSQASAILIESDTAKWNLDSVGRTLVWVWYKPEGSSVYRNLNLEILQQGLAIASSSANNRYGNICTAAIAQAKAQKLNVHSDGNDPDFYYGAAKEITLKQLRANVESYVGQKVAFEGVVTMDNNNGIYVQDYDAENGSYYGMYIYYGFNFGGMELLHVGNRLRIVGTVSYYEAGDSYQVSGLEYTRMRPNDPGIVKLLSENNEIVYSETDAKAFATAKTTLTVGSDETAESKEFDNAYLALATCVSINGMIVKSVYTTTGDSSSNGAMTLTCESQDGTTVKVRTVVLRDTDGKTVTESAFNGKTVDVKGIVDSFSGEYQIKVFSFSDFNIK